MLKFKELDDKKKRLVIIVSILVLFIGISFAYVVAQLSGGAFGDVDITSDTTDNLTFSVSKDISLNPTQFNVTEGGGGLSDTAVGTASLLANSTNNAFSTTYYVYFNINSNNYIYTTEDQKPEIVLTITDPNNNPVTELPNNDLTYVTAENADGTTVSGFDITTASGLFNIASLYPISSTSSTDPTVQNWTFTVTFINLTTNQTENGGKTLSGEVILSREEYAPTLAAYITSLYTTDGANNLYYHDGSGTYGSQEAGDNSYRYAGANPNNYVCFGSDAASCPTDNLYRIIGVFGDEVKLIKADYAQTNLLGTNGDFYNASYSGVFGSSSYYKGSLSQSSVPIYYWNVNGTNTWSASQLNTVNLNTNYLNNIGSTWSSKIANHTWQVGGNTWANIGNTTVKNAYTNEIVSPAANTTYQAKIGLMYVSDYGYAASPANWSTNMGSLNTATNRDNNWMFMGLYEWTISRNSDDTGIAFIVYDTGYVYNNVVGNNNYGIAVRPSFYLESSVVLTGGTGTASDPYRIS